MTSSRDHRIISAYIYLDELMYDDYDLDYTFARDHILDEDMYYEMHTHLDQALDSYTHDLDDDYDHRDTLDYDALAYKHYA